MTDTNKMMQEMFDSLKTVIPQMPEVKINRNGYEIRSDVLAMAINTVWQDYYAKLGAYETTVRKEGDTIVTKVEIPEMPKVPTPEDVLNAATKFYDFVNNNSKR